MSTIQRAQASSNDGDKKPQKQDLKKQEQPKANNTGRLSQFWQTVNARGQAMVTSAQKEIIRRKQLQLTEKLEAQHKKFSKQGFDGPIDISAAEFLGAMKNNLKLPRLHATYPNQGHRAQFGYFRSFKVSHLDNPGLFLYKKNLENLQIECSKASGTTFKLANLNKSRMLFNDFSESNFSLAQMQDINYSKVYFNDAFFRSAKISGKFELCDFNAAIFRKMPGEEHENTNTILDSTRFDGCNLRNANFKEASLRGVVFAKAYSGDTGGTWVDHKLANQSVKTRVWGADFSAADLTNADFRNADLLAGEEGLISFKGANMSGTKFTREQIKELEAKKLLSEEQLEQVVVTG